MLSKNREAMFEFTRTIIAILAALALTILIILFVSKEPGTALKYFLLGPFTSIRRFGNMIEMAIPFIFTGLGVCVMFQANQFNMIAEGAFFFGGLAAAIIAVLFPQLGFLHLCMAIVAGGIVGGLGGLLPGYLKAKWKTDEFVTSLMFNYVLLYLGLYFLSAWIRDPNAGNRASFIFPKTAQFAKILHGTRIHGGLILAIVMIILVYLFLYRTRWGYALRMTGLNIEYARYTGINTVAVIIYSQVIGGMIAGIGGATEILGMYQRFQWQNLPGYGFDGIIVAILARQNPLFVPLGAIFLAYLRVGADIMARTSDVSSEVVSIIQAIMIMLIAANAFLAKWRHKLVVKQSQQMQGLKEEKTHEQYTV
jgi:ABC-type uncharacterized transport system permease subunit